jgi:cytoskeletal protein RodZ
MSSDSTTEVRWPILKERAPFVQTTPSPERRRRLPRSAWLLTGLAFLCGGLVSAAIFSIGWRHQAQRDTAARSALAAATAHVHALEQRMSALRTSLATARSSAAQAATAQRALARAGTKVGTAAAASSRSAASVTSGAAAVDASAARIASELKTLDAYLTTTPTGQLDAGYIATQTSYLSQQLTRLQTNAGDVGDSVTSLRATLRRLAREARALQAR